jgi:hypothetical protein
LSFKRKDKTVMSFMVPVTTDLDLEIWGNSHESQMNADTPLQSNAMTDGLVKGNYICSRYCIYIISKILRTPCTALLQSCWWSPKYEHFFLPCY